MNMQTFSVLARRVSGMEASLREVRVLLHGMLVRPPSDLQTLDFRGATLAQIRQQAMRQTIEAVQGDRAAAANILGVSLRTVKRFVEEERS